MDERKLRGDRGEAAVAGYLRRRRYQIVASQFRCRFGEIDLIARSPDGVLCFVEVKTRTAKEFSRALEAVTPSKQQKIRTTAQIYLARTGEDCPCRFDVAEVYPGGGAFWNRPEINYIINAFV